MPTAGDAAVSILLQRAAACGERVLLSVFSISCLSGWMRMLRPACAMAAALAWHTKNMADNAIHIHKVRDQLIFDLAQLGVDHIVNFNDGHRRFAEHILSIRFPGVYGASLAAALSDHGVMVSTGSACSSGENRASENLIASGLTEEEALSTVRFSFDWQNTLSEADEAAKIIARLVPTLRCG